MTGDHEASRIGQTVGGKYRILRLLAKGGMGVVYEAQHTVVRRRFAIKFLRRDLAERRDILNRFQREAEAAGGLENQNVIAAVDFGISDDGAPYIVMEYLAGESLGALLEREGRLPLGRAADLIVQACRGVEAAHAIGIVHRDLKPHNLFVCRREDGADLLKVLDFGVAKLQAIDEGNAATRTGTVLGTAAYMSPEQARGDKTVDTKTDVYALGAILYELVSQRRPHPGDSQNAILHHIATQPPVPLESIEPDLPREFTELVKQAVTSDPAARPPSAQALAQALAPFARREVWPATREESGPARAEMTSTVLAEAQARPTPPSASSLRPTTADDRRPTPVSGSSLAPAAADDRRPAAPTLSSSSESSPAPTLRTRSRATIVMGVGVAVAALAVAIAAGVRSKREVALGGSGVSAPRPLGATARFYVPPPSAAAAQQIARLGQSHAFRDAALLTAMEATPRAAWFVGGSPQEVEAAVHKVVLRAAQEGEIPILAAYNIPYRDCAQNSAGGARDAGAYEAWIDGFVRGIGDAKAVVILEPDSLGIIPNNTRLDGSSDWCRPTLTSRQGDNGPAPGATPAERYALLASAIDRLASAPNALVYLDGTHSAWLPVGEGAYRLAKAGVARVQGFAVNVGNMQPTVDSIRFATLISKCLAYARRGSGDAARFRECPTASHPADPTRAMDWSVPEPWYAEHFDQAARSSNEAPLTHFVVDTSRNGRGRLDVAPYAGAPYDQPPEVLSQLREGDWCNPPRAALGVRPTTSTNNPLVDAYLWIKSPGESDGPCDIAGGNRGWDFSKYNPWGLSGDAQKHFDPLWGMMDPEPEEWFPEHALQLARDANPPLEASAFSQLVDATPDAKRIVTPSVLSAAEGASGGNARPAADERTETDERAPGIERPSRHPAGHRVATNAVNGETPAAPPANLRQAKEHRPTPTFDSDNPYR
jgi:endoglucanase